MQHLRNLLLAAFLFGASLALSGCGDNGSYYVPVCSDCGVGTYQFNGTVSGLASGTSIVLGDTSGVTTTLSANGSFSYQTSVNSGSAAPLIGVLVQPSAQNCTVNNGTPDANGNISVAIACSALATSPPPVLLTLLAGSLNAGSADGAGLNASFNGPSALAVDPSGNVYVADTLNNTIRKIDTSGNVTTLAGAAGVTGSSDGTGAAALFNQPGAVATDGAGNVYVADSGNNTIRMITPAGVVTTLAGSAGVSGSNDGTGSAALFSFPEGIAVNSAGTAIYVSDFNNSTIRLVTPAGVVTTIAGTAGSLGSADGTGAAAQFNGPQGIALNASGNIIVADSNNNTIRQVTPAGVVTTIAGTAGVAGAADGAGTAATFDFPVDVFVASTGMIYVADSGNDLVRQIDTSYNVTSPIGTAEQDVFSAGLLPGSLQSPTSVAGFGANLYVTTINGVAMVN